MDTNIKRKELPFRLFALIILFFISTAIFAFIAFEVFYEKEEIFDNNISALISPYLKNASLVKLMESLSFLASIPFLIIAYALLFLWYFFRKQRILSFYIIITGITGLLVVNLLKLLFQRKRPLHILIAPLKTYSFPSGHSGAAFIFFGMLIYLVWKTKINRWFRFLLCAFFALLAFMVGFSRVALGAHYASDVVAGFCVGFAWLVLSVILLGRFNKRTTVD